MIAPATPASAAPGRTEAAHGALDLLATMVAIVTPEGECEFANSSFEAVLGVSRRSMSRVVLFDWFVDAQLLRDPVAAVPNNVFSTSRLDAQTARPPASPGGPRQREHSSDRLAKADLALHGDTDGRGNLSESMLRAWCAFFIALCDDQVSFMTQMLDLPALKKRIAALIQVRIQTYGATVYRKEAILPLHHVLGLGPISRGEFAQMTGLGRTNAVNLISQLLKDGLLVSDTPKGEVGIGFPLDALNILFPNLYPEAATLANDGG